MIIKLNNNQVTINGLTDDKILKGFEIGFSIIEKSADIKFQQVSSGQDYSTESDTLYLGFSGGNHLHARGLYRKSTPTTVYLHSGFIPSYQSNTGKDFLWKPFASSDSMGRVWAHEWLHSQGCGHDDNVNCLMNSNSSTKTICPACLTKLQAIYGKPIEEPPIFDPIDENGNIKKGTLIQSANFPEIKNGSMVCNPESNYWAIDADIVRGSVVVNGKRYFPRGKFSAKAGIVI